MELLKKHLAKMPSGPIFHYTKQHAFISIVQNRELWASLSAYLNDTSEFDLATSLALETVRKMNTVDPPFNGAVLSSFKHALWEVKRNIDVAVFSFSAEEDLLSQWRAYSHGETGYSIAFDAGELKKLAEPLGFTLVACIYERSEQEKLMWEIVREAHDECVEKSKEGDFKFSGEELASRIQQWALIFKNYAFREEGEWRLISRPIRASDPSDLQFRPGSSSIIPYVKISIQQSGESAFGMPIKSVMVGPTPYPESAKWALMAFGRRYGRTSPEFGQIPVGASKIPYRHW